MSEFREKARQLAESMHQIGGGEEPAPGSAGAGRGPGGVPPGAGNLMAFQGRMPVLGDGCFVAPGATVIGHVTLGEQCSVWPGAVLRGDVNTISIGARSNVQDGAVVHVNPGGGATRIGEGVTIGHQAMVHCCTVGSHVIIGIHAVVLDGAAIGERCIIGAGAVVTPGTTVPPGKMVLGVPGRVARDLTPEEVESIAWHADSYVSLKDRYLSAPGTAPAPAPSAPAAPEPAEATPLPRYDCRRARHEVPVEAPATGPVWAALPAAPLRLAQDGGTPALPTEVRACWDESRLYVAFSCVDTDVWATFTQRDQPLYDEEVVEVFLCPSGNPAHYFEFEVNPRGAVFDARVFNPNNDRRTMLVETDWDAPGLRASARVSGTLENRQDLDHGWSATVAIPFVDLGLPGRPLPGTIWRANFYRIERGRTQEFSAWSPTLRSPADFHVPERFGEMVFAGD